VLVAGCARLDPAAGPEPDAAEPLVRVGLMLDAPAVEVGGAAGILVTGPDGEGLGTVAPDVPARVAPAPGGLTVRGAGVAAGPVRSLLVRSAGPDGVVRVAGRDYRGDLVLFPARSGVMVVNRVRLDAYVAGVVNAELGRRAPGERAAVYAQAVASRTAGARALGRYRARGYDLVATVADQAYGGVSAETELGWEAVRATRGEVLTWQGAVIDMFFHSTCGGRTAAVEEAFSGSPAPYLRSVSDRSPGGDAYCAVSPRFQWRESWTGDALASVLAETRGVSGIGAGMIGLLTGVEVASRTPTGRVAELLLVAGPTSHRIRGQNAIRGTLRRQGGSGGLLWSASFTIQTTSAGGRIVRLDAAGSGAGHAVGLCQWGAVGRARAGFTYTDILSAYFPGTEIRRLY
jgi:stage II sporulation protein D